MYLDLVTIERVVVGIVGGEGWTGDSTRGGFSWLDRCTLPLLAFFGPGFLAEFQDVTLRVVLLFFGMFEDYSCG